MSIEEIQAAIDAAISHIERLRAPRLPLSILPDRVSAGTLRAMGVAIASAIPDDELYEAQYKETGEPQSMIVTAIFEIPIAPTARFISVSSRVEV